jgi:hypothetical protein
MKNLILKSVVAACAVAACAVVAVRAVAFAAPRGESAEEIAAENADCAASVEAVEPSRLSMPLDDEGWRCEGDCDEHADCEFCNPPMD